MKAIAYTYLILVILSICALFLVSCSPQRKIERMSYKHPDLFARPCALLYPVTVRDSVVERWHPGEVSYSFDTVQVRVDCHSALKYLNKTYTKTVRVPVQVASLRVDTFTKEIFREKENTAKAAVAEKRATDGESKAERFKKGRDTWRWVGLISLAILAIIVGIKIFSGGFKSLTGIFKKAKT